VYNWLDIALDFDISERDFWEMTLAELDRLIQSKTRVKKRQDQEKASFDYILASLIGKHFARCYSSSVRVPDISEAYLGLFNREELQEQQQEQKDELSALRFKQFAQAYNKRQEVGKE
jgi:hypothetical protein